MKIFALFFIMQFLSYNILVANIRAVARLHYQAAAYTEMAHLALLWVVIRQVVEANTLEAMFGYILGGTTGTLLSMYLTRKWG